ncbi:hypothetical protein [Phreatobacter sp.]|uniref:hypothetical protein n=1 Tax=Phreatobacter sp. TaxID=1966341 RepID=UPI0025D64C0F|nr:hypothetical protein [Phreatobacter sp.]
MPTDLPDTNPDNRPGPGTPAVDGGPVRLPQRHVQIDHDVILPQPRPADEPDAILPGDREGDGRGPPIPMPSLP